MPTREEIAAQTGLPDDNLTQDYIDLFLILKGERLVVLDAMPKFQAFQTERNKATIASATRQLIDFGKSDIVLNILFEKLSLMRMWGKYKAPVRKPKYERDWLWHFKLVKEAVFQRAADVAGWILGVRLPPLPGVDWARVAAAVARHSRPRRSKVTLAALHTQIQVLDNTRPFHVGQTTQSCTHRKAAPFKNR